MVCKIVHQVPTNPTHQAILKHEIFHSLDTLASLKCSLIKRWFSPLSPQHFLKPSLGYAGINLWAFSPSAPATASSLNHFPAGFIGHAVVALLACFLSPRRPPLAFVSRRGGAGGLSLWGLAPRTYFVSGGHFRYILILLYLYNIFVIYARPIYARAEKCLQSLARRQICAVCGFCARRVKKNYE